MAIKSFSLAKIVEKHKPCMAMICVQLAYAGMALFSKAAIARGMNPFVFVAYRQAFATIALLPFALFLERKTADHQLSYSLLLKIFLVSLFGITVSLNLYTYAINYVSATYASASNNCIPSITFVIAVAFRIEGFSIREFAGILKFVGAVVSFSGAMVFAFVNGPEVNILNLHGADPTKNHRTHFNGKEKWIQGCLLILLANTVWSSWLVMQAPLVKQYPAKFRLTMLQCLFSFIQSTVWGMVIQRDISSWKLTWDFNLLSVSYCGVVVTGISYWLFVWAVEKRGPFFTAAFTPLQLIVTAIFSAFLWKEMLHLGSICGGMLLVGGMYCVLWGKTKEAEKQATKDITLSKEETNV